MGSQTATFPDGNVITSSSPEFSSSGRTPLPKIPREFFERSTGKAVFFLVYALALWLVPASGIYALAVHASLAWAVKAPLIFLLALVAQQGLHLFGWIGHESFHFNLFRGKKANVATGLLFSSLIVGHNGFGFALSHWHHHRFTNQPEDPDWQVFARFRTALSRFLFARLMADVRYLGNGLLAARGKWDRDMRGFPLNPSEIRWYARLNLLVSGFWIALFGTLIARHPLPGLLAIGLPLLLITLLTGLRPYLEHAGTGKTLFTTSRTRTSPLLSAFYFYNNYHLEHHLYPRVPCYNLARVHRWLGEKGLLAREGALIEHGFLNNLRYVTSRFQYPSA